ncbi:MAG TPA: hypothetical protein VD994_22070 [Prosthecobacter sp.]|nr:hypothetical protein [Prosthecobacter sp.]
MPVADLLKDLVRLSSPIALGFLILAAIVCRSDAQVAGRSASSLGLDSGMVIAQIPPVDLRKGIPLHRTEGAPHDLHDFSLSFTLSLKEGYSGADPAGFLSLSGGGQRLTFSIASGDLMQAQLGESTWQAKARQPLKGRAATVTLSIKRDPRQALAGLWLDGVEQSSLTVKPGTLSLGSEPGTVGSSILVGTIADIRLYDRALEREDIVSLATRTPRQRGLAPFGPTVEFADDECIAVLGGSEAAALMEDGTLEALLLAQAPLKRLKMRSLAWETDTVWRMDRPLNFGRLPQQLRRTDATSIFLIFGRQECLEKGVAGLQDFRQSLEATVGLCRAHTPRIVIVTPPWFEVGTPPQPDLRPQNLVLRQYQQAILDLAKALGLPAIAPMPELENVRLTSDGLNLSPEGLRCLARHIADSVRPGAAPPVPDLAPLLTQIRAKNQLWHDYWRPSNWAFLYGDRTAQPSSRDHLNPEVRWFPAELEKYRTLIEAREREIWRQAGGLERRVP